MYLFSSDKGNCSKNTFYFLQRLIIAFVALSLLALMLNQEKISLVREKRKKCLRTYKSATYIFSPFGEKRVMTRLTSNKTK